MEDTTHSTPVSGTGGINPAKRVLWKWSLCVTAVLVLVLMWQCGVGLVEGRRLANATVRQFHKQFNSGRYDDICRRADEDFVNGEELTKLLETVHSKMGNVDSEMLVNVGVNATTNGSFITAQYRTMFAQGQATEIFTFVKSDGMLRLRGYSIQSGVYLAK